MASFLISERATPCTKFSRTFWGIPSLPVRTAPLFGLLDAMNHPLTPRLTMLSRRPCMDEKQRPATPSCELVPNPVTIPRTRLTVYDNQAARIRSDDLAVTEFHVQRLFRHLRDSLDGLEVFDVIDRLQLDIVTEIFLGTSTDSLEHETSPFRDAMETLLKVNTRRIPLGCVMQLPDRRINNVKLLT